MFVMLTAMYHQGFSMTAATKGDYFVSWSLLDDGYATWYDIMRMSGARETALRALRGTDEFLDTTGCQARVGPEGAVEAQPS